MDALDKIISVKPVVKAIRLESFRLRMESDLAFAFHSLKTDLKGFMAHSIKLAEAFQLLDVGLKTHITQSGSVSKKKKSQFGQLTSTPTNKTKNKERELPICAEPHWVCKTYQKRSY